MTTGQIAVTANQATYSWFNWTNQQNIESAIDGQQTVHVSGINTLVKTTADPTTQDGLTIRILSAKIVLNLRNNGQIPVKVQAYVIKFRTNSADSLQQMFEEGLANKGVTTPSDPRYNLYDSPTLLKHAWIRRKRCYTVDAGREINIAWNVKNFKYTPDEYDDDAGTFYNKRYTHQIVLRTVGAVAHDINTTTNVGLGDGTLDFVRRQTYKWCASINPKYHYILAGTNTLATLNTPVVSTRTTPAEVKEEL